MRIHIALLATLLLGASDVCAEVRLRAAAHGPELAIDPVAEGVWTPRGVPDIYTVNPQGDLLGDGFPAHRSTGGRLVAAWQRPERSAVVILHAVNPTSWTSTEVATTEAVGVPIVTSLDSGELITWQSGIAVPKISAVVVDGDGGVSPPSTIVFGRLLGAYRVGDTIHVVAFDDVGSALNIGTFPASWEPHPIPVPVNRIPLLRTFGAARLETTPPPDFQTSPATWLPCVELEDDEVLLAWQAGRGVIGRVVLDADGVHGAGEFFRGPNGSCQAVLNAAARN